MNMINMNMINMNMINVNMINMTIKLCIKYKIVYLIVKIYIYIITSLCFETYTKKNSNLHTFYILHLSQSQ